MLEKRGAKKKSRKGFFFSMDALMALALIILVVGIAIPAIKYSKKYSKVQSDIIDVVSTLKVSEMCAANAYPSVGCGSGCVIPNCVPQPTQEELNNTILEQIGKFYIENQAEGYHIKLANKFLESVPESANVGIWLIDGNQEIPVANKSNKNYSRESLRDIEVASYLFSGVDLSVLGGSYKGFSAFSYLQKTLRTKYFYFGGYVGDGNLTLNVSYQGQINDAEMELAVNNNFTVTVNGIDRQITYVKSPSVFQPAKYNLGVDNFTSGENIIELKSFNATNLYVAGGYLKITYNDTQNYTPDDTYNFPGIDGFVNLYDSFYVPGDLNEMDLYLHFRSNLTTVLTIGNVTVVNQTLEIPEGGSGYTYKINKSSAQIQTLINATGLTFADLSWKTIPLRFGFEDGSFNLIITRKPVTAIPITDLSGSMGPSDPGCSGCDQLTCAQATCDDCKICSSKNADKLFNNIILSYADNFIGLVGYNSSSITNAFLTPNENNITTNSKVSSYTAVGGTCICCGINRAVAIFTGLRTVMDGTLRISSRVSQGSDDAEERIGSGNPVTLNSDDLELIREDNNGWANPDYNQEVGMRFQSIAIPSGATVTKAYIEFETDETENRITDLIFSGHYTDNAGAFSTNSGNITNRIKTTAQVHWNNVPSWNQVNEKKYTPNLSNIIQEIIDRPGWSSGNSVVIIVSGSGKRIAESYEGEPANAPLLKVEYYMCDHDSALDSGEECDDGNMNNNDDCTNACTFAACGDGIIWNQQGGNEQCDNSGLCSGDNYTLCGSDAQCLDVGGSCQPRDGDTCASDCTIEDREKVILVMSDGEPTYYCNSFEDFYGSGVWAGDTTGGSSSQEDINWTINAACINAYQNNGITVHAVGFEVNSNGESTLRALSEGCNAGNYSNANSGNIAEIYENIAENIINASYIEQTVGISGGSFNSTLYPDSYIRFNYDKETYNGTFLDVEVPVINETYAEFSIPNNSQLVETRLISYSGPRWTNNLVLDGISIYDLDAYNTAYVLIGDPYPINIPNSQVNLGEIINKVEFSTGAGTNEFTNGSIHNKIIYTVIKNITSLTDIMQYSSGCNWTIQFENEETALVMNIPLGYFGESRCYYQNLTYNELIYGNPADNSYYNKTINNTKDAQQVAVYNLLKQLDFDRDGEVNVKFLEENFELGVSEVEGVPYAKSAIVQVRKWY